MCTVRVQVGFQKQFSMEFHPAVTHQISEKENPSRMLQRTMSDALVFEETGGVVASGSNTNKRSRTGIDTSCSGMASSSVRARCNLAKIPAASQRANNHLMAAAAKASLERWLRHAAGLNSLVLHAESVLDKVASQGVYSVDDLAFLVLTPRCSACFESLGLTTVTKEKIRTALEQRETYDCNCELTDADEAAATDDELTPEQAAESSTEVPEQSVRSTVTKAEDHSVPHASPPAPVTIAVSIPVEDSLMKADDDIDDDVEDDVEDEDDSSDEEEDEIPLRRAPHYARPAPLVTQRAPAEPAVQVQPPEPAVQAQVQVPEKAQSPQEKQHLLKPDQSMDPHQPACGIATDVGYDGHSPSDTVPMVSSVRVRLKGCFDTCGIIPASDVVKVPVVGHRISVYWKKMQRWYEGTICEVREELGHGDRLFCYHVKVKYRDGIRTTHALKWETHLLLGPS